MKMRMTKKKKPESDPDKREKHQIRKYKKFYLNELQQHDYELQIKEYIHNDPSKIQE
jgi:hypothetical protein